jgi:hypothetical protein
MPPHKKNNTVVHQITWQNDMFGHQMGPHTPPKHHKRHLLVSA